MNASKENCLMAAKIVKHVLDVTNAISYVDTQFVFEFLEAARKKLPSEAAYAKDKKRRKATAK